MIAAIPFRTFPQLSLGPVTLRTFGVFVAAGIVVGVWAFLRYARDRDLDAELLSRLAWWVILLGIVGSRLLFVVTHWSEFADDPLSAFAVWQGGLQFSGAFLISIVVIVWFTRRHPEMPGLVVSDGIVYGLAPGLAIGRLGCIAVGEHLGTATGFPLAWKYLGGETREPDRRRGGRRDPQHRDVRARPAPAAGRVAVVAPAATGTRRAGSPRRSCSGTARNGS